MDYITEDLFNDTMETCTPDQQLDGGYSSDQYLDITYLDNELNGFYDDPLHEHESGAMPGVTPSSVSRAYPPATSSSAPDLPHLVSSLPSTRHSLLDRIMNKGRRLRPRSSIDLPGPASRRNEVFPESIEDKSYAPVQSFETNDLCNEILMQFERFDWADEVPTDPTGIQPDKSETTFSADFDEDTFMAAPLSDDYSPRAVLMEQRALFNAFVSPDRPIIAPLDDDNGQEAIQLVLNKKTREYVSALQFSSDQEEQTQRSKQTLAQNMNVLFEMYDHALNDSQRLSAELDEARAELTACQKDLSWTQAQSVSGKQHLGTVDAELRTRHESEEKPQRKLQALRGTTNDEKDLVGNQLPREEVVDAAGGQCRRQSRGSQRRTADPASEVKIQKKVIKTLKERLSNTAIALEQQIAETERETNRADQAVRAKIAADEENDSLHARCDLTLLSSDDATDFSDKSSRQPCFTWSDVVVVHEVNPLENDESDAAASATSLDGLAMVHGNSQTETAREEVDSKLRISAMEAELQQTRLERDQALNELKERTREINGCEMKKAALLVASEECVTKLNELRARYATLEGKNRAVTKAHDELTAELRAMQQRLDEAKTRDADFRTHRGKAVQEAQARWWPERQELLDALRKHERENEALQIQLTQERRRAMWRPNVGVEWRADQERGARLRRERKEAAVRRREEADRMLDRWAFWRERYGFVELHVRDVGGEAECLWAGQVPYRHPASSSV